MDIQFLILVWVVAIVLAILFGGPVLAILGMFFAWLAPAIIVGGIVLVAWAVFGRWTDRQGGD